MNGKRKPTEAELQRNYEDLANAIVIQACIDYQKSKGNSFVAKVRRESIKRFFYSSFFSLLTSLNPDDLINYLETTEVEITLPDINN